jgi:ketosteroid isomerase-like protein
MASAALTNEEIARAVSGHRFDEAIPHFAEDIEWDVVGSDPLTGKTIVTRVCEGSAEYLAKVSTEFLRFDVHAVGDMVIVDSLARYTEGDDVSIVSSCDLYTFADGHLRHIRSYNVELASGPDRE